MRSLEQVSSHINRRHVTYHKLGSSRLPSPLPNQRGRLLPYRHQMPPSPHIATASYASPARHELATLRALHALHALPALHFFQVSLPQLSRLAAGYRSRVPWESRIQAAGLLGYCLTHVRFNPSSPTDYALLGQMPTLIGELRCAASMCFIPLASGLSAQVQPAAGAHPLASGFRCPSSNQSVSANPKYR